MMFTACWQTLKTLWVGPICLEAYRVETVLTNVIADLILSSKPDLSRRNEVSEA